MRILCLGGDGRICRESVLDVSYAGMKSRGFILYPGKLTDADTFRIGTIGHVFPDDIRRLIEQVPEARVRQ